MSQINCAFEYFISFFCFIIFFDFIESFFVIMWVFIVFIENLLLKNGFHCHLRIHYLKKTFFNKKVINKKCDIKMKLVIIFISKVKYK